MFSILQKPQETVSAEDLETLQNEIERRLVDVATSKWNLKRELSALNSNSPDPSSLNLSELNSNVDPSSHPSSSIGTSTNANGNDDGTGSDGSQTESSSASISGSKRVHRASSDRPSKRFKLNSSSAPIGSQVPKRLVQSKHKSRFRNSIDESRSKNKKQIVKNEAPAKLWPFVDQFCAAPTEAQIHDLEEMIEAIDNDKDYFKVPPLGKRDSPSKADNGLAKSQTSKGLGALTQRLVSSLIEDSESLESPANDPAKKKKNTKPKGGKTIDVNNAKSLEKRIRQELEEYDILDHQDDIPYGSEEDEILRELVACQHELFSIQRQSKDYMQRLLKKAKRHLELENEREKLREANADVISAYQKLVQARQKKRNPTKKERDAAIKSLRVQEAIFRKCDELYLSGLNRHA